LTLWWLLVGNLRLAPPGPVHGDDFYCGIDLAQISYRLGFCLVKPTNVERQRALDQALARRAAKVIAQLSVPVTLVAVFVGVWADPKASANWSGDFLAQLGHFVRSVYTNAGPSVVITSVAVAATAFAGHRHQQKPGGDSGDGE
jgi:hypothetical protein